MAELCSSCLIQFSTNSTSCEFKLQDVDIGLWSLSECVFEKCLEEDWEQLWVADFFYLKFSTGKAGQ